MNQIAYTVRMPDDLRKAVRMAAAAEDKSMNQWIVDVLKQKVQKENAMKCYDPQTNVWYPHHEEMVVQEGSKIHPKGFCSRCGAVFNHERFKKYARGQEAIDYAKEHGLMLSKANDPQEGERIDDVTPEEAEDMIRENLPEEAIYLF